jgi:hypothetical protein
MKAVIEFYVNGKQDALQRFPDGSEWGNYTLFWYGNIYPSYPCGCGVVLALGWDPHTCENVRWSECHMDPLSLSYLDVALVSTNLNSSVANME